MYNYMDATRQEIVTAHVRRAIMTGSLQPGERLIEQTLAAELRMSRGPVRDGLRRLEQEGLVQIYRNRGAVVSMLGLREAYEFYLVRGHLESLAVRLARDHMQLTDIAYLQSLVDQMADLCGIEADWLAAADLDLAFHRRIVACSHNRSLMQAYGAMDVKINALFITVKRYLPARLALLPERHQKVVDVFRTADWWRAEAVVSEHWFETAAQFKQLLDAAAPAENDGADDHG
jgi:DNA-binding GntR family transcriptional regulator